MEYIEKLITFFREEMWIISTEEYDPLVKQYGEELKKQPNDMIQVRRLQNAIDEANAKIDALQELIDFSEVLSIEYSE